MFSKDIKHTRYRTPRTLNEAFGPNAKLHAEESEYREALSEIKTCFYVIATGAAIGMVWYLSVFLRA